MQSTQSTSQASTLEQRKRVRWAPDSSWNIQWDGRQHEGIPLEFGAGLGQFLQIPEFANVHTEERKKPLMQYCM